MEVAHTYRVPRSILLGRPLRATTIYHYDQVGRLTHSTTEWEPLWTDDDFAWALGKIAEDADRCTGCGQPLSETTRPDAEGAYEALLPIRCHACTPLERRREEYANTEVPSALRFGVRKRR